MSKTISRVILFAALLAPATASAKHAKKAAPAPAEPPPDDAPAADPAPPAPSATSPASAPTEAPPAVTETPARSDAEVSKRLGVGYKAGNGWGFIGGDVIINVVDHVSLDLQLNWDREDVGGGRLASGWAFGGEVQLSLKSGQVSSPYLGLGLSRGSLSLDDISASGFWYFANAGYEFRWRSGLGILLGLGIIHVTGVHAQSATNQLDLSGATGPNLEAGLRYMFM
jgi:hypothetical protein